MKQLLRRILARRDALTRARAALHKKPYAWRGTLTNAELKTLEKDGYMVEIRGGKPDEWDCEVT